MIEYALVATHHKTGCAWMNSTFREISRRLKLRFVKVARAKQLQQQDFARRSIFFFPHASIKEEQWLQRNVSYRIFHLIRDPRDVVISGMHYHRESAEKWLHITREKFDGVSYQVKLNSLHGNHARYLFEMENNRAITRIKNWNYNRPHCLEVKYEDLIRDFDMTLFTKIVTHLGFSDDELNSCREAFWKHSIFGGKADRVGAKLHVRSGEPRQWESVFDRPLGEAFIRRFGDILIKLGYEADDSWLERLPDGRDDVHENARAATL
jgi:Sulfotransferase domain